MAASFHLQTLHKSPFLQKPSPKRITTAKFNLYEILGGRGLCNGEQGLQQELKKNISPTPPPPPSPPPSSEAESPQVSEEGFEKELLGLTGGFPGGEKGLKKFIQDNPPPPKEEITSEFDPKKAKAKAKAKAPELPLLLPGMIAIVKSPRNPFHMYCGIVQRISDGKAGVLFEGGNWDKLVTFRLDELERRDKGPPMVNPRSAILELEEST
ncbi:hypothetical protein SASPL_127856 [Salvia splendens]|uniref:Uncharacterized protein n=1 Tax=Salvia splendens TaxID=180675 RepID=A0A8X8ZMY3_SALSN|nr:NAD(P)H-quinone oxidoreductase subunit S, chloroplastic-like [Salvia splendens]KAG6409814.1 hypothetical protein SASPL_127856 [Salvia splendens]